MVSVNRDSFAYLSEISFPSSVQAPTKTHMAAHILNPKQAAQHLQE